ncbi:MAG: ABC transporter ATP-binding protein [Bacilli bacterium]|nr:ABC transporter ATP-binding protein [Bacilli bacterium]
MAEEFNDIEKLKGDKKIPRSVMFKRTLKYVKPEWPSLLLASILVLVSVAVEILYPLFMQQLTNTLQTPTDKTTKIIIMITIGYFTLGVILQIATYFEAMILQKAGTRVVYKLRMEVFEHILNMSQNQFNEMPVGSLVTRVVSYTSSLSELFTSIIVQLTKNILMIAGVYAMMFVISWKLSLIMLIFVVVVFAISLVFRNIIHKIFTQERKYISDLNTFLNENLSGMKIIQIFNQEKRKHKEFNEKNDALRRVRYKVLVAFGIYRPLISFIYFAAIAVTFSFALQTIIGAGEVVAFYLYLSKFFNPIQSIADQLNGIQRAVTASERLFNLMDVKPDVLDEPDAVEIDHFEGKIEFKNVWFAYKQDQWILKDVSFTINPRETCAFVGATGAGKTTILGLIVRNYEIQKGQILIDGIDIKRIKIQSLRRAIGQMLQDVFLFSGTIKNNITLRDERFTQEDIEEMCHYVNADQFIDKLEHKYDEEVIERGENYSQGQRQLLSFARTVVHKPQILILDEATANIDTETEVLIQDSLEKMKNIGTMLIVAHRLSTVQKADQIIVLQNGEVAERGTHQQLLKNHGYYYKLYKLQFEER